MSFRIIILIAFAMSVISDASGFVLRFEPVVAGQKLDTSSWFNVGSKLIKVNNLRFYISDIVVKYKTGETKSLMTVYNLLDFERGFQINDSTVADGDLNQITFRLGVDSLTNVSGAMGGDLDPTNGMYWTWQSGYINLKVEGEWKESSSNHDSTQIQPFEFHLGGYQFPYAASQLVPLNISKSNELIVHFKLDDFFEKINLSEVSKVMSPSDKAVQLSRFAAESFHVKE